MTAINRKGTGFKGLLLFALATGLLGSSGFIYAADRTVVGELWSQDG